MDAPTADYIRLASRVDFDALNWGEVVAPEIDRLQEELDAILPWIEDVTGHYFGVTLPDDMDTRATSIPSRKEALYRKAVRMAVEWEAYRQHPDQVEGMIDIDYLQSMTAGTYSETRRSANDVARIEDQVHPWPDLDSLLRSLRAVFLGDNAHEVPVVGVSDPLHRGGEDILNARRWPTYDPYDMRPRHVIIRPSTLPWEPDEPSIEITGLPNG